MTNPGANHGTTSSSFDDESFLLGVISDTHGLLRPELFTRLAGVDHLIHAGDIGSLDLLGELEAIAPLTAVWGNTDGFDLRERLPAEVEIELAGIRIAVTHGHRFGSPTPTLVSDEFPSADLVVFGHTHQPLIEHRGTQLIVNPGSCGPRRFNLPVTLARVEVTTARDGSRALSAAHIDLDRPFHG
jgi:uncharacterized protein